jgi:mono/diheme cytochrome c family protein
LVNANREKQINSSTMIRPTNPLPGMIMAAILLPLIINPVQADKAKSVAAGKALAEKNCARCHSIGKTGASPEAKAPAFRRFPAMWPLEYLEEALAEGIVVGHSIMPEFEFETKDITNLLDYIASLTDKKPPTAPSD